jgi:predicted amino acid dehydrogenase
MNMCPGAWVIAKGGFAAIITACGVTRHARTPKCAVKAEAAAEQECHQVVCPDVDHVRGFAIKGTITPDPVEREVGPQVRSLC